LNAGQAFRNGGEEVVFHEEVLEGRQAFQLLPACAPTDRETVVG
jgi:hypothetical protein